MYREPFELAEAVATFFGAGFEAGEPAVAVVTKAHAPLFADRLARRGWDVAELERDGALFVADADETLAAILEDGMPSSRLFTQIVGTLVDRAGEGARGGRVRVFGEMVDILCRRGEPAAADVLEELWNRLGATKSFSLLCGYKIDVFDRQAQIDLLPRVYRSHSEVVPGVDAGRMERAVETALNEVLGQANAHKVYAQVARQVRDERIPRANVALMWVSAHMPRTAERVLTAARAHYVSAAAA